MRTILIIGAGQAGLQLTVPGPDGGQGLHWAARLDAPAQSVDQRVKIPGWMRAFEQRSGKLLILDASAEDLEEYATGNDLVLAAAGRGPIASLFERDAGKSPYDKPQRALTLTYVTDPRPRPDYPAVCFNLHPRRGRVLRLSRTDHDRAPSPARLEQRRQMRGVLPRRDPGSGRGPFDAAWMQQTSTGTGPAHSM